MLPVPLQTHSIRMFDRGALDLLIERPDTDVFGAWEFGDHCIPTHSFHKVTLFF